MKNKKISFPLLGLGALASITAPIVTTLSCSSSSETPVTKETATDVIKRIEALDAIRSSQKLSNVTAIDSGVITEDELINRFKFQVNDIYAIKGEFDTIMGEDHEFVQFTWDSTDGSESMNITFAEKDNSDKKYDGALSTIWALEAELPEYVIARVETTRNLTSAKELSDIVLTEDKEWDLLSDDESIVADFIDTFGLVQDEVMDYDIDKIVGPDHDFISVKWEVSEEEMLFVFADKADTPKEYTAKIGIGWGTGDATPPVQP